MKNLSSIFKDFMKGAGKVLKDPFAAFTVGNLSSNVFKLGVYQPSAGVPAQAPQPLSNAPKMQVPSWMYLAGGGVLLLLLLKR